MGDLGRRLVEEDRKTLPDGTLVVLERLGDMPALNLLGSEFRERLPDWVEGDVCIIETLDEWGYRNLRLNQWSHWPGTERLTLLEDKADD